MSNSVILYSRLQNQAVSTSDKPSERLPINRTKRQKTSKSFLKFKRPKKNHTGVLQLSSLRNRDSLQELSLQPEEPKPSRVSILLKVISTFFTNKAKAVNHSITNAEEWWSKQHLGTRTKYRLNKFLRLFSINSNWFEKMANWFAEDIKMPHMSSHLKVKAPKLHLKLKTKKKIEMKEVFVAKETKVQPAKTAKPKNQTFKFRKPRLHLPKNILLVNAIKRLIIRIYKQVWLLAYLIICITAAQVTLIWWPKGGVYINTAALIAIVALALVKSEARLLAISTAIIPVVNMVMFSVPKNKAFTEAVIYYGAILLLTLIYRFLFTLDQPLSLSRLRPIQYLYLVSLMVIIGQVIGLIGYGLLRHHYEFQHISLPLVALCSVVFAISEEMFFRGLIQQRASYAMRPALAVLLSVILFITLNLDHATILTAILALISGTVLSLTYFFKRNLILNITINATSKLIYLGLFSFLYIALRVIYLEDFFCLSSE